MLLISIETHIASDFPFGGGPDSYPSLDPHMMRCLIRTSLVTYRMFY